MINIVFFNNKKILQLLLPSPIHKIIEEKIQNLPFLYLVFLGLLTYKQENLKIKSGEN